MPKKQSIPTEIQEEVQKQIDDFNHVNLEESISLLSAFFPKKMRRGYSAHFKGKFPYLDRIDRYEPLPICRLTGMGKWIIGISPYLNIQVKKMIPKNGFSLAQKKWMVQSLVR